VSRGAGFPEGSVLLQTAKPSAAERRTLYFEEPEEVWSGSPERFSWEALRRLSRRGFLAGWLSYDLGEALAGMGRGTGLLPSFWMARYGEVRVRDEWRGGWTRWRDDGRREPCAAPRLPAGGPFRLRFGGFDLERETYLERVAAAREAIAGGHYYQVNLTVRGRFGFSGDPAGLLRALLARQGVAYGALVTTREGSVVSGSPELFLRVKEGSLLSRPMKGTAVGPGARGRLMRSEKDRAENLMIADLMRNDLGKVATSVRALELFRVERYATLHQMVSVLRGELAPGRDGWDALAAGFPPGSCTGAPKGSAMAAAAALEASPRGLYTGALGYACPWGESCFSVVIRTAEIVGGELRYGTGGGITFASEPAAEWEECRAKLAALAELQR